MRKFYISTCIFLILPCFCLLFKGVHAQNITYQVDIDDLYMEECSDCNSYPDPEYDIRFYDDYTGSGNASTWSYSEVDEGCGWLGASNYSFRSNETVPEGTEGFMQLDASEDDNLACFGDDNVCGGYSTLSSPIFTNYQPCTWHYFTNYRYCGDFYWGIEWSFYYSVDNSFGSYDKTWIGYDNDWHAGYNWSGCGTPTSSDNVYIPDPSNTINGNNPTISSGADCYTITIDSDNGAEVTIDNGAGGDLEVHQ